MYDFEHLNYYELLNVSRDASQEDIKRAYRQEIARYHPDRNMSASPEARNYARQRSQRINEAYRVLGDFHTRTAYNRGQPTVSPARRNTTADKQTAPKTPPRRNPAPRDHQSELYDQAQEHLRAGRWMQATATLRELQQLNPFYRDSATLLAQAEAALRDNAPPGEASAMPESAPAPAYAAPMHARRSRKLIWVGGGSLLVIGGIAAALFFQPQLPTTGAGATESTATPTAAIAAVGPASSEEPEVAIETQVEAEPLTPTPAPLTPTPAPLTPTPAPPTPTPTPAPPTPAPPTPTIAVERGETVFTDEFGAASQGWAVQQGPGWSVGYTNGAYRVSSTLGEANIWSFRTIYTVGQDFSLGTDVRVLSGAAGLLLRYVDAQNYLAYMINPSEGSYLFEQHTAGVRSVVAEGQSEAIRPGNDAINRLVARLQGNRVQLFVNNEPVADTTLSSVALSNTYGLLVNARGTGSAEALFDRVEIRTLE
jgi:curved DNA-binding protein CbpA